MDSYSQLNNSVIFKNLGLIDYKKAWDFQEQIFQEIISIKSYNRTNPTKQKITPNYFFFCEHPHVYTLGKSGDEKNLLVNESDLKTHEASFYKINRGGDITYHGPGQIVGYPILDLENFFTDIHLYIRNIEEVIIQTLNELGVSSGRIPGSSGVWIDENDKSKARKICAVGVRTSRWVTMHGFAFNINPDLTYFENIIPCGITDKAVTSLFKETGVNYPLEKIQNIIADKFALVFRAHCSFEKDRITV